MKVIQELVAYFERSGRLTKPQVSVLATRGFLADDAPDNLMQYTDHIGEVFYFRVTGADDGAIWGTGIYTADSSLAAAAVHAGAVALGQTGVVKVTIVAPPAQFRGSTRRGIRSNEYDAFGSAYIVEKA